MLQARDIAIRAMSNPSGLRVNMICWLSCLVALLGCSSPSPKIRISFAPDASIQKYNRVHVLPPANDPRHLQFRVLTRLRAQGFDASIVESAKGLYYRQGTGFLISTNGHVLTCAHVLAGRKEATVWLSGVRHRAELVKVDESNDLALLRIPLTEKSSVAPLHLSTRTNDVMGKEVFTIGFPMSEMLGIEPRLTKGIISASVGLKDNPDYLQISAAIQPGNSGGPLFDETGEVMGVVNSTVNALAVMRRTAGGLPQNVNFAVKGSVIKSFLERAKITTASRAPDAPNMPVDVVKNSVTLIRGGWVAEGEEARPEMVCRFSYAVTSRTELKLKYFVVDFTDLHSGKSLFRTGIPSSESDKPEDVMLDTAFKEVQRAFKPLAVPKSK